MPIVGIDYDKCINCYECVKECPAYLYYEDEKGKITYDDPTKRCILCGHCIAVCPEDAIIHEGMGETSTFEGIKNPESLIPYETLYKFLRSLRVTRRYKVEKVPEELINNVLDAMRFAPTGANIRGENFTVISDTERLNEISNAIREAMESDKSMKKQFGRTFKMLENEGKNLFFNAPHLIVVHTLMLMNMNYINIGNIVTYGRLAAHSLGLGTCYHGWTQLALEINPKIKKLIKASGTTACAFTLGYPDVKFYRVPPRAPKRVRKV
ncbi:MAG: 4Fe-4S dicluster domain-containing protein [Promethearchaeota archaeon]|nr:MAG: 4Fe-4S dicluster domain-containing protein [Candidatus Lokiarchaeota archaeon]